MSWNPFAIIRALIGRPTEREREAWDAYELRLINDERKHFGLPPKERLASFVGSHEKH